MYSEIEKEMKLNAPIASEHHQRMEQFVWVKESFWKEIIFLISCVLTGGILVIVCIDYPGLRMHLISDRCGAEEAEYVLVKGLGNSDPFYVSAEHHTLSGEPVACFEASGIRYIAHRSRQWEIEQLPLEPQNFTERFVTGTAARERPSREEILACYGLNAMKIEAADAFTVALKEVVSPFYLFQYFAVAIWLYTDYVIYSVVVLFITLMSIVFCVKAKLFNLQRLHDLAGTENPCVPFDLSTNNKLPEQSDRLLVPGDCFVVTAGMTIPCDAILLRGRVVVDESMLTGESVPVTKTEFVLSGIDRDATKRAANILYSGTQVKMIGQGSEAIAMAFRTGFRSARGELIAALITPKQEVVSFLPDAMLAIVFMVVITTAIFGWSADELKKLDTSDGDVVIAYLTALTIAVPPGLVACLSIGTSIAVVRLQLLQVSITDTGKLTAAGYVTRCCFDKTGTLTDEQIQLQGTCLYQGGRLVTGTEASPLQRLSEETMAACHALSLLQDKVAGDPLEVELFRASHWTLQTTSDKPSRMAAVPPAGHPLAGQQHIILRHFEFSPEKLRAATVLQRPNSSEAVFLVKGSPEMLSQLCLPQTLPTGLEQELAKLAKQGFRVLALAYRNLSADQIQLPQNDLERDLHFLGLVYFSNQLKKDTFPKTISGLQNANVAVNMITGDHVHTAAAISESCGILSADRGPIYLVDMVSVPAGDQQQFLELAIIDAKSEQRVHDLSLATLIARCGNNHHLQQNASQVSTAVVIEKASLSTDIETASGRMKGLNNDQMAQLVVTGAAFRLISEQQPDLLAPLCRATAVFARMKPADKKTVVQKLMQSSDEDNATSVSVGNGKRSGTHVLFCGDGANDMEALAAATVGVSLCDTATTVAAAIVSTAQSPLSVLHVLREGRCALATAYVLVNFNIMYAIIQLFMTCYLNNVGLVFGDYMYLIQDMFFSLVLGLCIGNTPPSDTLSVQMPPASLFAPALLAKLFVQLGIFPVFQYIVLQVLYAQRFLVKFETDDPLNESFANEGSALNIIALAQLMIASVVVTIGEPFRKPWYTNKAHVGVLLLHSAWIAYLLFGEENDFMVAIDNKHAPKRFSGILVGIILANVAASAAATKLVDWVFFPGSSIPFVKQ